MGGKQILEAETAPSWIHKVVDLSHPFIPVYAYVITGSAQQSVKSFEMVFFGGVPQF